MRMDRKSDLYYIFKDLTNALKTKIDSKYIFEGRRPDVSDEPLPYFVVIETNVNISDLAAGGKGFHFISGGSFRLFVKSKANSTLNVEKTCSLMDEIHGLFPISGERWIAAQPIDMIKGYDGNGFHEARISFSLHSR